MIALFFLRHVVVTMELDVSTRGLITDWWIVIPVLITISDRLLQLKRLICPLLFMTVPNLKSLC